VQPLRKKVIGLAFAMEEPLNDAINLVQALRLIGHGLAADHDDAGRPIAALAWAATDQLDELKRGWQGIINAARGRRATRAPSLRLSAKRRGRRP
jgi:hypothetical protein